MKLPASNRPPVIPILVWVAVGTVLCLLPWRILGFGFLPPDDALRHAAKVLSGKSWQEILVMRPGITIDHNPGWHWILGWIHRLSGGDASALVRFSVASMFLLFALSPLPWLKKPETWLASLALLMLLFPYFALRAFVGRPLLLSMAVTLILLSLWTPAQAPQAPWKRLLGSTILIALATWVHGSWYLFALLPAVFFLAREWRKGLDLTFCWLVGTVGGALLTGQPFEFLRQSALIPFLALGQSAPLNSLVGEFQPNTEPYPPLALLAVMLAWRKVAGRPLSALWRDPIFWLVVLGWLLSFRVVRFWLDWGLPALALWLARQFQDLLPNLSVGSWKRIALGAAAGAALFLFVASDRGQHWSQYGRFSALDASKPADAEWLPEPGGILYSVNLSVFYDFFFTNPRGNWRYALGFEPSFMQEQNLAVYQDLWRTLNAIRACAPWVRQMTSADRLVLLGPPGTPPAFRTLEWRYAGGNTWVGRLPKATAALPGAV